jgi:hypothetical protein
VSRRFAETGGNDDDGEIGFTAGPAVHVLNARTRPANARMQSSGLGRPDSLCVSVGNGAVRPVASSADIGDAGAALADAVDALVPGWRKDIGDVIMSGWLTHDRRGAVVLARGGFCCGSLRESFWGW